MAAATCFLFPLAANAQRASRGNGKTSETYLVVHVSNPPDLQANGRTANGQPTTGQPANGQPANGQPVQPVDYSKEYMVVTASELKSKKESYEKDYKTLLEKWKEEKANIDPDTPRPPKPTIKTLKTFKLKEVADEYLKKLLKDLADKDSGKSTAADPAGKPVTPR